MINEILRDLINEGKVAAFVDDMLVGTETEERHDDITNGYLLFVMDALILQRVQKCKFR